MPKAYFPLNGHSFALFLHCLLIVVNGLSFLTFHGASKMGGQIIVRGDRIFLQWTVQGPNYYVGPNYYRGPSIS